MKRPTYIQMRATPSEKNKIWIHAFNHNMNMSDYIRAKLNFEPFGKSPKIKRKTVFVATKNLKKWDKINPTDLVEITTPED